MAGGHPEFTGADEENQRTALAEYIRRGLKPDLWWIDAGWYRCHYDWGVTGDWIPDAERFPHGLAPIGEDCRRAGVDFLLWFEPERVRTSTAFCREHPDWLLPRKKSPDDLLVNLGCRACCDTIIDTIDALIKESGIRVYRQDFNFSPASVWAEAEAEDRVGAVENAHVQGLLRLWDTLLDRNPGLWIDMCASGGRRNDLETMRRAVPLHYTDIGYGDHPVKQKQHRQMFEWIPYFRAHNMSWDDPVTGEYTKPGRPADAYSYYVAMAPCMTDMTPYDADEERFALARKMQAIWRRASALMLTGDFYPLTECRESARDFFAVQFHDPETGRGMVEIVSNNANPDERFTVRFAGLEPGARYLLTNAETGARRELTAEEMASGVEYALPRRSGLIDFYEKKV